MAPASLRIPMALKQRINEDMKSALRARQSERLSALRLLLAGIKQREIDGRVELDDAGVVAVIETMLKQRRDSIAQFEAAARHDLAEKEKFESAVLQAYMPEPLSETEVASLVEEAIHAAQAGSMKDMGRVMAILKPKLTGRADMAKVSALLKARLSG
jgi:uncharacterized protein YqeY